MIWVIILTNTVEIFYIIVAFSDTRVERKSHKLHKMGIIFDLFKKNLLWVNPSYRLCVDETLYSFRGTIKIN